MKADADCRLALLVSCVMLVLSAPAHGKGAARYTVVVGDPG